MPTIQVRYFAQAARLAGVDHEEIPWGGGTVAQFTQELLSRHPELATLQDSWMLAWNEEMVASHVALDAAGTLAVMPPFSGG